MKIVRFYSCPLCSGPAARRWLGGQECYTKIACARCGIFVVESPHLAQAWARLAPEDALLVAFLPAYIRRRNRRTYTPLLTSENWRALARRGRIMTLPSPLPATIALAR